MNAYAKIGIKVGVVVVICLILLVAYSMVGHKAFAGLAAGYKKQIDAQAVVAKQLDGLLQYKALLPEIRCVQLRDMETIRLLVPPSNEFILTSYLRQVHALITQDHLETAGIVIGGSKPAPGGTSFDKTFSTDVAGLQKQLGKITTALQSFQDNKDKMNDMLNSFQFYKAMSEWNRKFRRDTGWNRSSFILDVGSWQLFRY